MAAVGKQAWFALMNRKSRTAARRSPEQTRPRLLKEYRAPAAAACSHAAAGSTHHARLRSDQEPPPPGGPRFGQPGRPTREWSGSLAQTRGQDRQDYVPARTRSTICRRNSGEYGGRVLGIGSTSGERLRVSTKPGQSQHVAELECMALVSEGRGRITVLHGSSRRKSTHRVLLHPRPRV